MTGVIHSCNGIDTSNIFCQTNIQAAVIIGDVLFGKLCAGKKLAFAYTLFSVIVGAIIYYLVLSIILWLKFPSDDLKLFSAIVVAIFLAIPYLKNKKKATRGL